MSTKPSEIQQRSKAVITDVDQFKEYISACRRPGIPLRLMNEVDRPKGWEKMNPNTVVFPKQLATTTPPPAVAPVVAPVAARAPFQTPPPKAKSPVESPYRYNQNKQYHPVGSPYHPDNVRWNLEQIELQKAKASSLKAPPSPPKIETAQDVVEALKEIPPFEIFANEVAKMDADDDDVVETASFDERDELPKKTPDVEFVGTKQGPEVVFLETRRPVTIDITGDGVTVVRSNTDVDAMDSDDAAPPTDFDEGNFVMPNQFVIYYMRLRHYRVERNMMMNTPTNMKRNGGFKRMAFQKYMKILTKIENYLDLAHVFIRQYNRRHAHEPEHGLIVTMMSNLLLEFRMKHVTGPAVPNL